MIAIPEDCETWFALQEIRYNRICFQLKVYLHYVQVKDFLELFDGPIGFYGQNCFTLDSLLLTIIPPYDHAITTEPSSVDHCDLVGTNKSL